MNLASWIILLVIVLIAGIALFIALKNKGKCSCCKDKSCCRKNK